MTDFNKALRSDNNNDDNESDESSDDNLEIVIESPSSRRKALPPEPTETEQLIIASMEEQLEKSLEEIAAKTNLNATNVKNIIKHVVTNKHVLALVRKAENPHDYDESDSVYEPKLTRAKAKELSTVPLQSVSWATPKPVDSEVQFLMSEELQEDSSGDEYVPESEDDLDSSIFSDPPSVPPATPPTPSTCEDVDERTNFTDDGVFKIPPIKRKEISEAETNIARRTRSKLSLSSTPLEVIEEAFVPPDITTDMYDMPCDNEDWMDFLKKFTRPLDEIAKGTEDEEHDPEYNILADEEIDKLDKEELRDDKAVIISKKELNNLIAELFDFAEACISDDKEMEQLSNQVMENDRNEKIDVGDSDAKDADADAKDVIIEPGQLPLLEQQMRQHVQLLTQNFILTYLHPEIHQYAPQFKEYLLNLKCLCDGKERSAFHTMNLIDAIALVEYWEDFYASDCEKVNEAKLHIEKTMNQSFQRKQTGNVDIVTFAPLFLETMSKSPVFLYPSILPKIPFKTPRVFSSQVVTFTNSEDQLIALGLEQFTPIASQDRWNRTAKGDAKIGSICSYIQQYMMPNKPSIKIKNHVFACKHPRCANNPIKYYFQNKKAPPSTHYVTPLDQLQILPPCKRLPDELPYQWRMFLFPNLNVLSTAAFSSVYMVNCLKPQVYYNASDKTVLPHGPLPVTSTPNSTSKRTRRKYMRPAKKKKSKIDPITKFVNCLSRPSRIEKLLALYSSDSSLSDSSDAIGESVNTLNRIIQVSNKYKLPAHLDMLPSMPQLGTPIKTNCQNEVSSTSSNTNIEPEKNTGISTTTTIGGEERKRNFLEFSTISSTSFQQPDTSTEVEFCKSTNSFQTITTSNLVNDGASTSFENLPSSSSQLDVQPSTSTGVVASDIVQESCRKNGGRDNTEDINALMIASSTVKPTTKKEPSGAEKKRTKLRREFVANLTVATPEDPGLEKQKNEMFALAYYDKLRETLDLEEYHKIMQILNDHEDEDAVGLYKKVDVVLRPKYPDLADEFLLFLRERDAAAVDKLIPWIKMNNKSRFLRKLEIYFKDQPAQLRKIYKSLTDLSETMNVTMEKVKSTLLPMFKGNAILSDMFLQNFLTERPPPSLLEGPYETIDISKEMSRPDDEEIFETITVPDGEDKYGGTSCICNCHQIEDPEFKSRYRHCIRCGTRFMSGKVYIQTGRGLRPATVSFLTSPDTDHNIRLIGKASNTANQRKRSPSKISPTKENVDEESEDDGDGKKKSKKKSPRKRKKTTDKMTKDLHKITPKKSPASKCDGIKFSSVSSEQKEFKTGTRKRSYSIKKSKGKDEKKTDKTEDCDKTFSDVAQDVTPEQQKSLTEDSMEWEDHAVLDESFVDIKTNSPEQNTAESESEFCEESSQDNCESDSNSSIASSNNQSQSDSNAGEERSWTRDEDKIILETFQKENDKESAFQIISDNLKNRTVSQISKRFNTLMSLLMETLRTP